MKTALALLVAGLMAATTPFAAHAQPAAGAAAPAPCESLAALAIAPEAIGLPTHGGRITAAAPANSKKGATYCMVSGSIAPVDPQAPEIHFQVALPAAWNGKAVMLGGGGFNGTIPDVAGSPLNTPPAGPSPLERGYAVFASDSGHQSAAGGMDGHFMVNDEAYRNWLGEALKKTHDSAMVVIAKAYGRAPSRAYFLGGSTGGREGLRVASLWPKDWDGVVALYPARDPTAFALKMVADTQAMAAPGAWLNTAQRDLLHRAALEACDARDGVADGLISDVKGCYAAFDPGRARVDGHPLRCADGKAADACLSDVQLAAIRTWESPIHFGFPLASGETGFPGYNVLTSDTGIPSKNPAQPFVAQLGLGNAPASSPPNPGMALSAGFSDNFVRFLLTRDPSANPLTFNVADPGPYARRLSDLSSGDTPDKDLSGFAARGGKLLMLQGEDDLLVSPRATEAYVAGVRARLGEPTAGKALRYYEVAGFGHAVSTVFMASWDELGALEAWVEQGRDPGDSLVVTDLAGVPGRTRPLCQYPAWPRYHGGDVNVAASFTCATR